MKYRKKPIVIDAVQFTGEIPYPDSVRGMYIDPMGRPEFGVEKDPRMILDIDFTAVIQTLEGMMYVHKGDWIITGIKGEVYACKPDIFEATYEAL